MNWSSYERLVFDYPCEGVLRIHIDRPDRNNAMDERLHTEFSRVFRDVEVDAASRVVVVTGRGKAFSAGGDFEMVEDALGNYETVTRLYRETADIVYDITNCSKPVISAINGVAVGAGLAVALMADISIIGENARLTDGHVKLGVGAGDHAAIIWPLLCGLAKARYYLLTCDPLSGEEAERIGLVSLCVEDDDVQSVALDVASRLSAGSQPAIRLTKHALNNWYRSQAAIFDASLAFEFLGFGGPDAREGLTSHVEKRPPRFGS